MDKEVRAVEIDLSDISESNYPKDGIIFSEVPLIVKGIPKKNITVVGLDDIYLGSINASYYKTNGTYVNCSYIDDDPNAKPVGIISAKAIWIYYALNRNNNLSNSTIEDEIFDPRASFSVSVPNCIVKLNKVVLFTQGGELYVLGGRGRSQSKCIIIGSLVCPNQWQVIDKESPLTFYNVVDYDKNNDRYSYRSYDGGFDNMVYANSLRKELPPRIPITVRVKDYKSRQIDTVENFLNQIGNYLDTDTEVPQDVYMTLLE